MKKEKIKKLLTKSKFFTEFDVLLDVKYKEVVPFHIDINPTIQESSDSWYHMNHLIYRQKIISVEQKEYILPKNDWENNFILRLDADIIESFFNNIKGCNVLSVKNNFFYDMNDKAILFLLDKYIVTYKNNLIIATDLDNIIIDEGKDYVSIIIKIGTQIRNTENCITNYIYL